MRLYRPVALALAITFALVGFVFLIVPGAVLELVQQAGALAGRPGMPASDVDATLFRVLAGAYMYLVSLFAWMMFRQPQALVWPTLLAHAKLTSALLSFVLFAVHAPYLVYPLNAVVDGAIGLGVLVLRGYARAAAREPAGG